MVRKYAQAVYHCWPLSFSILKGHATLDAIITEFLPFLLKRHRRVPTENFTLIRANRVLINNKAMIIIEKHLFSPAFVGTNSKNCLN